MTDDYIVDYIKSLGYITKRDLLQWVARQSGRSLAPQAIDNITKRLIEAGRIRRDQCALDRRQSCYVFIQ